MSKRPSLSVDRWMPPGEVPEFTRIRTSAMADLYRASRSITTISRILHNSIGDGMNDMVGATIDDFDKQSLCGAVECLGDFIYGILEEEAFDSAQAKQWEVEAGHE
jgi:hypothetical protein